MKKTLSTALSAAALAAALVVAPSAMGSLLYEYDVGPGNFGNSGLNADQRAYDSISASYNTDGTLTFATEFGAEAADGFWTVFSTGPNPKRHDKELAILYGDLASGDLYAYEYNGLNSANSWNTPGNLLDSFSGAITNTGSGFSLSIDANNINGADLSSDWTGVEFGEKIGLWYHPTWGTNMTTDPFSFSYNNQGWYDISNHTTTVTDVPEPGTVALFASAMLGLFGLRRRRIAAA